MRRSIVRTAVPTAALALLLAAGPARADAPPGGDAAAVRALFPGADAVAPREVVLTDELAARIEKLARARVPERRVTFYTVRRGADVAGYAVVHSHVVRTKRETLAIAFEPDGRIRKIQVLAFLEPDEYRPSDRWLKQLEGKGPNDPLRVGDDLVNVTGSTLTSRGIAEQSRWLLQALKAAVLQPGGGGR